MSASAPPEDRLADLEALLDISKAMAVEKDLNKLLDLIIERTTQVMRAERTSLFLVDHETNELWTRTAEGLEIKEIRLPVGQGISGMVAQTKQLVNIADPYSDPRFDASWDKKTGFRTRSILCAPLITHEDKVVGVVQVLNKKGGAFTSYDEDLLLALAGHAAIALDQAELIKHYVEKQKMAAALQVAQQIQASVLPTESPMVEGFDISGRCWPCDETGGDYYDFIHLSDGRLALAVGDVTGHGVGSALLMMAARSLLHALFTFQTELQQVANEMNSLLAEDVSEGMFMTLFLGVLDPDAAALTYLSAGHPSPLWVRKQGGEVVELEGKNPPMAIAPGVEFAVSGPIRFEPGDVLFLFTDGASERLNAEQTKMFGVDGVRQVVLANLDKSSEEMLMAVREAVLRFGDYAPKKDDLTLVSVKAL